MKKRAAILVPLLCALLACTLLLPACGEPQTGTSDTGTDTAAEAPVTETPTETEPETEPETEEDTTPVAPFYACLFTGDIGNNSGVYDTLEEAQDAVNQKAYLGLRVCDSNGRLVYAPYTELQCDLLREAKWVTDYVRENKFTYGDAPLNPAINNDAKKVSCDRLVCWVYYRVGFTDQPRSQGLVVSNFFPWCEKHGFEKITKARDLQPGDLVGVRPSANGKYPEHVFMYAGPERYGRKYSGSGNCRRYDCGSDTRIRSVQPFVEPISDFMCAYRPVWRTGTLTRLSTGTTIDLDGSYACELYVVLRDAAWTDDTPDTEYTYTMTIEGHEYEYAFNSSVVRDVETGKTAVITNEDRNTLRTVVRDAFR